MVIQHNIPALNSHRNLLINNNATSKNLEKLSSGYRINRAADDAAGLAISEKMRGQIRGLAMAEQNCENGIALIQTAEGGLQETHAILHRMRELAVQSANGTYQDDDRANIELELQALKSEIDRIASSTNYNGMNLLDGTLGGVKVDDYSQTANVFGFSFDDIIFDDSGSILDGENVTLIFREDGSLAVQHSGGKTYESASVDTTTKDAVFTFEDENGTTIFEITIENIGIGNVPGKGAISNVGLDDGNSSIITDAYMGSAATELIFQIGANGTADQRVGLNVFNMATGSIGVENGAKIASISVATRDLANKAIDVIDAAVNQVSQQRADLGALQNRMEHTINSLGVTRENLTAAESTIRDVDMAGEMMEFTKNSILVQAAQAMLAQANALPQGILSLLG